MFDSLHASAGAPKRPIRLATPAAIRSVEYSTKNPFTNGVSLEPHPPTASASRPASPFASSTSFDEAALKAQPVGSAINLRRYHVQQPSATTQSKSPRFNPAPSGPSPRPRSPHEFSPFADSHAFDGTQSILQSALKGRSTPVFYRDPGETEATAYEFNGPPKPETSFPHLRPKSAKQGPSKPKINYAQLLMEQDSDLKRVLAATSSATRMAPFSVTSGRSSPAPIVQKLNASSLPSWKYPIIPTPPPRSTVLSASTYSQYPHQGAAVSPQKRAVDSISRFHMEQREKSAPSPQKLSPLCTGIELLVRTAMEQQLKQSPRKTLFEMDGLRWLYSADERTARSPFPFPAANSLESGSNRSRPGTPSPTGPDVVLGYVSRGTKSPRPVSPRPRLDEDDLDWYTGDLRSSAASGGAGMLRASSPQPGRAPSSMSFGVAGDRISTPIPDALAYFRSLPGSRAATPTPF